MKNHRRFQNLILILLSVFILTSCTGNGTVTPQPPLEQESILLKDVAYQAGGNFDGIAYGCVPATTWMNVSYLGADVTLEDVLNAGVVNYKSEIIEYAQKLGFNTKNVQLSINEIMNALKKGYPVIVGNKFSLNNDGGHASLVIGIDSKVNIVTTHDPNTIFGSFYERSFEEFEALSLSPQQGKYDTVVIYEGSEPWK